MCEYWRGRAAGTEPQSVRDVGLQSGRARSSAREVVGATPAEHVSGALGATQSGLGCGTGMQSEPHALLTTHPCRLVSGLVPRPLRLGYRAYVGANPVVGSHGIREGNPGQVDSISMANPRRDRRPDTPGARDASSQSLKKVLTMTKSS